MAVLHEQLEVADALQLLAVRLAILEYDLGDAAADGVALLLESGHIELD